MAVGHIVTCMWDVVVMRRVQVAGLNGASLCLTKAKNVGPSLAQAIFRCMQICSFPFYPIGAHLIPLSVICVYW